MEMDELYYRLYYRLHTKRFIISLFSRFYWDDHPVVIVFSLVGSLSLLVRYNTLYIYMLSI